MKLIGSEDYTAKPDYRVTRIRIYLDYSQRIVRGYPIESCHKRPLSVPRLMAQNVEKQLLNFGKPGSCVIDEWALWMSNVEYSGLQSRASSTIQSSKLCATPVIHDVSQPESSDQPTSEVNLAGIKGEHAAAMYAAGLLGKAAAEQDISQRNTATHTPSKARGKMRPRTTTLQTSKPERGNSTCLQRTFDQETDSNPSRGDRDGTCGQPSREQAKNIGSVLGLTFIEYMNRQRNSNI